MSDVGNVDVIMWLCASPQTANELSLDLLELPDQDDRTFVSSALRDPTADDLVAEVPLPELGMCLLVRSWACGNHTCVDRVDTMSPCAKWNLPLEAREWPSLHEDS
jgi:hypothetical protein